MSSLSIRVARDVGGASAVAVAALTAECSLCCPSIHTTHTHSARANAPFATHVLYLYVSYIRCVHTHFKKNTHMHTQTQKLFFTLRSFSFSLSLSLSLPHSQCVKIVVKHNGSTRMDMFPKMNMCVCACVCVRVWASMHVVCL